ncbi:MAG: putative molybdenum carrier protein [Gammaproteobacteria bacterium]|nr:MAG: putative molybdenum carrier protein [Gammaproteobacteria bacterium]
MIEKIISGGQTGVDRAALDAAIELGILCGGWCPKGRRAENGVIPERYPLRETNSEDYRDRTARNVRDADGTLILARGALEGGTAFTRRLAIREGKPCLVIDLSVNTEPQIVHDWLKTHAIRTLNIAGPRESVQPGIHEQARYFLRELLGS